MDSMTPLLALTFTVFTVINLLRFVRGRDWNGALTIIAVWIAGVVVVALFGASKLGENLVLGDLTGGMRLGDLGFADLLILGLQVGSTATTANEFRAAFGRVSEPKPNLVTETKRPVEPS